ncbi:MAG: hypothetical protein AABZ67_00570 [Pseudomonadota bacterium]
MLKEGGYQPLDDSDPFYWSTALDGVDRNNFHWDAAGRALAWYAALKCPGRMVSLIAHSHGGQVAAYAARFGLRIDTVVTVATPVRADMGDEYRALRDRSLRWVHIYTDEEKGTPWQRLGELGLNTLGGKINQAMPLCAENVYYPKETHGSLVAAADLWRPSPDGEGWRSMLGPLR